MLLRRIRGSLGTKVVLPILLGAFAIGALLQVWNADRAAELYRIESESRAASAFRGLETSIAATGGAAQGPLDTLVREGGVVNALVVGGPEGIVVAAKDPAVLGRTLGQIDGEAVDDIVRSRADADVEVHLEHESDFGGLDNVVHAYGRLRSAVMIDDRLESRFPAAHVTVDVSDVQATVAVRQRNQMLAAGAAVAGLALIALLALRWCVTRRIGELAREVGAADGVEHAAISDFGTDQIGQLAAAFRHAQQVTEDRNLQLAESNRWLEDEMARRQAAEAENRHQARHDALTGLANRVLAAEFATAALGACDWTSDRRVAALHVNLDRFKVVNESLGHNAGDKVLKEIARRLLMAIGPDDLAARVSGDEFVVLVDERREAEIAELGAAIVEHVEFPVELGDGNDVFGSASVGIALGRPGDDAELLLRKAGLALSRAKQNGRARLEWFDEEMQAAIEARAETEVALRYAIEESRPGDSELELHYQPIVDLAAGRVRGFESLVRWRRDGVLVPPTEFVQVAEDTGLIVPLGEWILKEACAQAGQWQQLHRELPPTVTINVSGRQLSEGGVASIVRAAITAHRLDPHFITLELTESVLLDDVDRARASLDELKALGVKLAIDDFGTGYSSLTYLRQFPIDVVKVDQSFVRHLGDDTQDSTIVAAVVAMGRALGLRVVCEGVETAAQMAALMMLGADDGQGWFFAKALTADVAGRVYAGGLEVLQELAAAGGVSD